MLRTEVAYAHKVFERAIVPSSSPMSILPGRRDALATPFSSLSSAIIRQHSLSSQSLYSAAVQLRTFWTFHCPSMLRNPRIAAPAQKQATLSPEELRLSLLRRTPHKMHSLTSLFILLLYVFHISTTGISAAELKGSTNPRSSSDPDESSSLGSGLITHLRRMPPLLPPNDTLKPQKIPDPIDTTSIPIAPIQVSSSTSNPNPTPLFASPPAQTSLPNPHQTGFQIQALSLSLTQFDVDQCHKNKHCLLCHNPDTVLTCYKYNCQCQRGHPAEHYMAASRESCYDSELCLSCPPKSMPYTWGRMAVCLTIFKHKPIKGEANPLTNWTEDGVKGLPVSKVVMSQGSRLARRIPVLMSKGGLGIVTVIYLLMV
ncbi:hypothetical protein GJ744_003164 [Endocarpon pusillum]|uniref:Uncharacterized protein n=1 Tax=Endocarpon pusillum TaxID=364733 RepID=A0A8H7E9P7_9EURO|nr:hypothetical protein GJ744_003164 [Endocarpon pusillum]